MGGDKAWPSGVSNLQRWAAKQRPVDPIVVVVPVVLVLRPFGSKGIARIIGGEVTVRMQ